MIHLIIDYNVLIHNPNIVAYSHPNFKLWLEKETLKDDYYKTYHAGRELQSIILEAVKIGHILIYETNSKPYEDTADSIFRCQNPINEYYSILTSEHPDDDIYCVASNINVQHKRISAKKAIDLLKKNGAVANDVLVKRVRIIKNERIFITVILIQYCIVIAAMPLAAWAVIHITKNIFFTFLIFCITILFVWNFYRLRRRNRFLYGGLETIFGILLIAKFVFISYAATFTRIDYFSLLSGGYVVIRGLDNMETGLKTSFRKEVLAIWEKLF